jgi:hypothetical protein
MRIKLQVATVGDVADLVYLRNAVNQYLDFRIWKRVLVAGVDGEGGRYISPGAEND